MSDWHIIIGGGSGVGSRLTELILEESQDNLMVFDRAYQDDSETQIISDTRKVVRVTGNIDSSTEWSAYFSQISSIRSLSIILPSCRPRDLQKNKLGFTPHFFNNCANVNSALCNLILAIEGKLIQSSSVVFLSSVLGSRIAPEDATLDYHASKAVLDTIMRYMAVKLAPRTSVNCVSPGLIARDGRSILLKDERVAERVRQAVPLGRPCSQAEVARVIWSLNSGRLPYVSGQTILMDGGSSVIEPFANCKHMGVN